MATISVSEDEFSVQYVPGCGVCERGWHRRCCQVRFEPRPQVYLFPDVTSEGRLSSGPPYTHMQTDRDSHKEQTLNLR